MFAVFSLGNIIYLIMELEANMGESEYGCPNPPFGWIFIFRLLFTAAQTFFLFKNPVVSEHMKGVGQGIYPYVSSIDLKGPFSSKVPYVDQHILFRIW